MFLNSLTGIVTPSGSILKPEGRTSGDTGGLILFVTKAEGVTSADLPYQSNPSDDYDAALCVNVQPDFHVPNTPRTLACERGCPRSKIGVCLEITISTGSRLRDGCYLLRSNLSDWDDTDLWRAYIQLTEAAFRIHKHDLTIRPIWQQKQERVLAHILVCFLAFVLWKTLAALVRQAGLGDESRRVIQELTEIRLVEVVLRTADGIEIRKRCITRPSEHQAILLHHLGLHLPT